jgi:hypothetical protein
MSYFLFGSLTTEPSQKESDDLAWRLADAASSLRLFVLLGPNIHQHVVLDILRTRGLLTDKHLPLLLTRSPLCDTSEELLADYIAAEDEPGSVISSLNRVSDWLRAVLLIPSVCEVHLLISDGFDDAFTELEAGTDQLAAVVMARVQEEGDVPSLSIRLVPPGREIQ